MVILSSSKIKAFTLVETIVSLIIITVVLSLSLMIFNQVTATFIISNKMHLEVEEVIQKIQAGNFNTSETSFKEGDFKLEVEVKPYKSNFNLKQYTVLVLDNQSQKVLTERNILVCEDEN